MIWDTSPQALREWRNGRSAEYEDATNASLENPMPASIWGMLSDALEKAVSETATPESEAPSMGFHVGVKTRKKASGKQLREIVARGHLLVPRSSSRTLSVPPDPGA